MVLTLGMAGVRGIYQETICIAIFFEADHEGIISLKIIDKMDVRDPTKRKAFGLIGWILLFQKA